MALGTKKVVSICNTCPWVKANQGKRHAASWYSMKNLRRLWNGLRTGKAPGMICHSTDPMNQTYGGDAPVVSGHESECGGAVVLIIRNMNALNEKQPQPIQPGLSKGAIAQWAERYFFGDGIPKVESKFDLIEEVGVPWDRKNEKL